MPYRDGPAWTYTEEMLYNYKPNRLKVSDLFNKSSSPSHSHLIYTSRVWESF